MKPLTWASRHRASAILAVGSAGALMLLSAAAPASGATHPRPAAKVAVPQGIGTAALKDASVFGPTPASTPETVSFVLRARNLGQLEGRVEAGMPGGYLSVSRFARDYGQQQSSISALEKYLGQFGITTSAYADGLNVTANGTAGQFDSALSVQQHQYRVAAVPARHGMAGLS